MRKIITGLVAGSILLVLVTACCPPTAKKVGETNTSGSKTPTEKKKTEFNIGEAVELGQRVLTVNAITRNYDHPNEYYNPPEGKEWVIVPVIIENKGENAVSFNLFDFKIQDSKGGRTHPIGIMDLPNALESGEIAPGGRVEGVIPYEVPSGDTPLKLVFKPAWGTEGEVTVNLD